ncbi:hypothetical protein H696_03746 [Fonticula alba]|uniref:ABC transporter domain-containing protein n=1 Tax=Fonticula alba TaxID=691883 RepID=A0A058Z4W6_FONAL|nr:hypothetical protein H696_03746 [Fonticula alba]KCV69315.1 hypothetical protein H696_03746 [Fonticula alba]|eukprot:XP_009495880.1 hypothetical protein H696_03746 [Fonticula alba]
MYVPQRPPVQDDTPSDMVRWTAGLSSQSQREKSLGPSLDPIEVGECLFISPERWETPWNQLSGGEVQRISLAMSFSRRPDLLLLDEPTSALDTEATMATEELLLSSQSLAVIVTHNDQQEERLQSKVLEIFRGGSWVVRDARKWIQ